MITFLATERVAIILRDDQIVATIHPFGDDAIQIMQLVPCAISAPALPQGKDQPVLIQFSEKKE